MYVSVISKVTHMLQFLHQMFNLFALLRDNPLKPATPLTNGAIDEMMQQFAPLSDDCLLQRADCRESLTLIGHLLKGTPKRNRLDSSPGSLGATCEALWTWRSHAAGKSVCSWLCVTARRPAADIRARCQRYCYRMWHTLDNNWDNHVIPCC